MGSEQGDLWPTVDGGVFTLSHRMHPDGAIVARCGESTAVWQKGDRVDSPCVKRDVACGATSSHFPETHL